MCGRAMKKNGRTGKGVQRWKCPACRLSSTMPQRRRRRERTLEEFLSWLLGPSSQRAADSAGDARALRKRIAWCWRIRPRIAPPDARRHTVMADGTYMGHGWCLIIAIDGQTGEVLDWQWCAHESKAAYLTLFSRLPAPDVLIADGLRGAEAACTQAWPAWWSCSRRSSAHPGRRAEWRVELACDLCTVCGRRCHRHCLYSGVLRHSD